jgi:membrane carboxypeptidase/penicillin-binding protein
MSIPERFQFHRRRWFPKFVFIALNLAVLASIGVYLLHRHFVVKAASFELDDLAKMESSSTIYDRRNHTFGHIYLQNRDPIGIGDMPPNLIKAVIAAEDVRFYEHTGIDFKGISRALLQNLGAGRKAQGGSTITQQLARNTYGLTDRTYYRKVLEIYLSWRIEKSLSKEKILELYLNRIYLGTGLYGVEAAARGYFGKPAKELTTGECATLAGLIKSPNKLSPWSNPAASKAARDVVLRRMLETGVINEAAYNGGINGKMEVQPRTFGVADSYALEMVRQQIVALVGFDRATSEGLRVFTTLDTQTQRTAEIALKKKLDEIERNPGYGNRQTHAQYQTLYKEGEKKAAAQMAASGAAAPVSVANLIPAPEYIQGGLIAVDNADGGIIALIGGREFKHNEYNRPMQSRRQTGTAFAPLVFAAGYERGVFPGTLVQDALMDNRLVMIGGLSGVLGEWGVERADNRYEGLMPATFALIKSKNAATVRFGNDTGLENVLAFAKKAGIKSEMRAYPATFLGASEITLAELTLAYTMFPNAGWKPQSTYVVKRIEDREGNILFEAKPPSRVRVTDENTAYQVHNALSENLKWGVAADAVKKYGLRKFPAGAKTGTSYNSTDVLTVGYTTGMTCAVWAGFDKPQSIYRGAFGSDLMLPVWSEVMNVAAEAIKPLEFAKPPGLKRVEICYMSGQLASDRCSEISDSSAGSPRRRTTYFEYATPSEMPKQICLFHTGGVRPLAQRANRDAKEDGAVRAVRAVDLETIPAVTVSAPAVVNSDDPFKSIRPPLDPDLPVGTVAASGEPAIRRAIPVATEVRRAKAALPLDADTGLPDVKIEPPTPIDFN